MNSIIDEYQRQGYVMTVRQLYYQLVARDYIANNMREYKNVAETLDDAKLAGLVDWDAIEDRTRQFKTRGRWSSGGSILRAVASQYHMDLWDNQDCRVFAIVEKEALVGVLEGICHNMDIPLLAARGYPSSSVLRKFAVEQIIPAINNAQEVRIIHLGDHDPSGLDMTRDLEERLRLFSDTQYDGGLTLERIALNMEQVEEVRPPENPAKTTDARFAKYAEEFGESSWELDALSPEYLNRLVRDSVDPYIDEQKLAQRKVEISEVKSRLLKIAEEF